VESKKQLAELVNVNMVECLDKMEQNKKTNVARLKEIVRDYQYKKIGRFLVDVQTANLILKVKNSLGKENAKKYTNIINSDIRKAGTIAWRLTK